MSEPNARQDGPDSPAAHPDYHLRRPKTCWCGKKHTATEATNLNFTGSSGREGG